MTHHDRACRATEQAINKKAAMSTTALLLVALTMFCGCDPGHALAINNKSDKPHHIAVIYPEGPGHVPGRKTAYTSSPTTDTISLAANAQVCTESGLGGYPNAQIVVIDNTDTVKICDRTRVTKKPRSRLILGGVYTLTIN